MQRCVLELPIDLSDMKEWTIDKPFKVQENRWKLA